MDSDCEDFYESYKFNVTVSIFRLASNKYYTRAMSSQNINASMAKWNRHKLNNALIIVKIGWFTWLVHVICLVYISFTNKNKLTVPAMCTHMTH